MLAGGNPCRARAYSRAADAPGTLTKPTGKLIAAHRLQGIPGVGEAIAGIIETLDRTHSHPTLDQLRAEVPASVLEMLTIPGLRADEVRRILSDLGFMSVRDLEIAAREGRLRKANGLAASVERKILQGLEMGVLATGARHAQGRSARRPGGGESAPGGTVADADHARGCCPATERLLRAAAHPFTTIIGHMTGRLLLHRKGYDLDVEKVLNGLRD